MVLPATVSALRQEFRPPFKSNIIHFRRHLSLKDVILDRIKSCILLRQSLADGLFISRLELFRR